MSVYLLPPVIDPTEIIEVTKKAGIAFEQFESIRDLILKTQVDAPVVIGTLRSQDLLVLNRYASSLVKELPSVIMSAPGVVYTGDWVTLASALPALDWKEVKDKLSKSGHTAYTPDALEKRDLGSPNFDTLGVRSLIQKRGTSLERPVGSDESYNPDAEAES